MPDFSGDNCSVRQDFLTMCYRKFPYYANHLQIAVSRNMQLAFNSDGCTATCRVEQMKLVPHFEHTLM
jgi:hypothetical protein